MSIEIGQIIGKRYRVDEFIGRGGMAEVYRVFDQQRAAALAMKVLQADLAEDLVFLNRFRREARTLTSLQHPSIVRFYELEQCDDLVFMLMDFVKGSGLRKEIFRANGTPFTPARVLEILRPVCSALHYAHQMGVIHCDVKPANILLDQTGRVLVTDFGIARMTDTATMTMVGAGTPAYMAPEQAKGLDPSPQTDIYGLGIVLYEMLTGGERPFTGEKATATGSTSEKVMWEKLYLAPLPPSHYNPALPAQIDQIVLRCLSVQPAERYTGTLELLEAIETAFGGVSEADVFENENTFVPGAAPASARTSAPVDERQAQFETSADTIVEPIPGKPVKREASPAAAPGGTPAAGLKPAGKKKGCWILLAGAVSLMVLALAIFGVAVRNQVVHSQTATAAAQSTIDRSTRAAIETYQASMAQTVTAEAQAKQQAREATQQSIQATEQALPTNPKQRYVVENWRLALDETFQDDRNKWCSTTNDYSRRSGTYDESGDFQVASGLLQINLIPVDGTILYYCYPDFMAANDFYASVDMAVLPDDQDFYYSIGLSIESSNRSHYTYDITRNGSGEYTTNVYQIGGGGSNAGHLTDDIPVDDIITWPARLGLLVQDGTWTLFLNDVEVDEFTVIDSGSKYVGLEAYLDRGEELLTTYLFDNFKLWIP